MNFKNLISIFLEDLSINEKLIIAVYLILIIIFGFFSGPFLIINYKEILTSSLAFIGTVLAIFFTLLALPIQNILGRYSQDLVDNVEKDQLLRSYLFISLFIFGFNISVFVVPFKLLIILSYIFSTGYLVLFYLITHRVFYLLDIRNQIKKMAKDLTEEITTEKSGPCSSKKKEQLNDTDIIFDIIQKAIQENRFEIVDSGLNEVVKIVKEYIKLYNDYLSKNKEDDFISNILINLINSKNLVSKNNHPKILTSIANSTGIITEETVKLVYTDQTKNYLYYTPRFLTLLSEMVLYAGMEEETRNIPLKAIDHFTEVGKVAIIKQDENILKSIINVLVNLSRNSLLMNKSSGDVIARKTNTILANLFFNYVIGEPSFLFKEKFIGYITKEISDIIQIFINESTGKFREGILDAFTKGKYNIFAIVNEIIKEVEERNVNIASDFIKYLLNPNIRLSFKSNNDYLTKDFLENTYDIGIILINAIKEITAKLVDDEEQFADVINMNNKDIIISLEDLLENEIFKLLQDIITDTIYPIPSYSIEYCIESYFSLIGILFVESEDNKYLKKLLISQILSILKIANEIEDSRYDSIYSTYYVLLFNTKLLGFWIYRFYKWNLTTDIKEYSLRLEIKKFFERCDEFEKRQQVFLEFTHWKFDGAIIKELKSPLFYSPKNFNIYNEKLFDNDAFLEYKKEFENNYN